GARPGSDQRLRVHLRLERVHLRADLPWHRHRQVHAAHLCHLLLRPWHGRLGVDHGCFHPVHDPGDDLLPDRPAPHDQRPGGRGGEGMSQDTDVRAADPVLGRLAEAILIAPFPGTAAPGWVLDALGRGLAGVTLYGQNIAAPGQVSALTAALREATAGDGPVIAI